MGNKCTCGEYGKLLAYSGKTARYECPRCGDKWTWVNATIQRKDTLSIWWVIISCGFLFSVFAYSNLVEYGFIDPYANQRLEKNFTVRSVQLWEDPRWTQDRYLISSYDKGVFFLEGNITENQLNMGDTYRIIYKNVLGIGDIPFYYAFTIERIE